MKNLPGHSVILVPGLGKQTDSKLYQYLTKRWSKQPGISAHIFDCRWDSHESAHEKIIRLKRFVEDNALASTEIVSFSAGCPLSVCAYEKTNNKIRRITLISGKLKGVETIGPAFRRKAPALAEVVDESARILEPLDISDKKLFVTMTPVFDGLIPKKDMRIKGIKNQTIPSIGHPTSIGIALLSMYRPLDM